MAQTDVYSPKPLQLWKTVLNWLAFLVQIFVQIIRGTPPLAQVFSYVGSTQGPFLSPPSSGFKPLSVVEIPLQQPSTAAVDVTAGCRVSDGDVEAGDGGGGGGGRSEKLTHEPHTILLDVNIKGKWACNTKTADSTAQGTLELDDPLEEVVLDLDETLVCAYETTSLPAFVLTQATEAGLQSFDLECVSSEKERDGKPKINYVTVFERPGLHEFLEQLSEFADLVLFTAGLEGYAKPLVDRIDLKNLFSRRFYRPSTVSTEYRDHVKDLACITKDLCRVVIVDNNPFSFLLQPLNGIPCVPFAAGQPQDEQLLEVLLPLLKDLSQQKDVRPMLYDKFHMPEWFQNHGIPASLWPL